MALSREHGLPQILEWGRVVRRSALTRMGRAAEGISEIRKSLDHQRQRLFIHTLAAQRLRQQSETIRAFEQGTHRALSCKMPNAGFRLWPTSGTAQPSRRGRRTLQVLHFPVA